MKKSIHRNNNLYKKPNISLSDKFLAYLYNLNVLNKFSVFRSILKYRILYRNYLEVILEIIRKRYPIEAKLRNGNVIILHNNLESQPYGGHPDGFEYDTNNDIVILSRLPYLNGMEVKIYGGIRNGDIRDIFVNNIYEHLPVEGRTVVDIGANIADSCIYFALHGANKVIGLEPFPRNYELAEKNIQINNLGNKIFMFLAGCDAQEGETFVDPNHEGTALLKNSFDGIKIPLVSLEQILEKYNLNLDNSITLKMDCEGCEYASILTSDKYTLQKFGHIMLEYHYGYKDLKYKLEECGFKVSVTRPRVYAWDSVKLQEGYLLARKC